MVSKKIKLKTIFNTISLPLKSVLETSSISVIHSGTKGDVSEYQWIKWLKNYLPNRYNVNKGFVIDYKGNISEQQDIIIYDSQYTPYLLNSDGVIYVPAESVYAVIEVKQKLNKEYIDYAGKKIESVRKLSRTSKSVVHIDGKSKPKKLHTIIGGILTLEYSWKDNFGKSFIDSIKSLDEINRLNIGCCLKKGSFIINYNDEDNLEIKYSDEEDSLNYFFIKLISMLQDIGTVPAIDFEKYLETIIEEKTNKDQ